MHTPDKTFENIAKIAALFPNCVTETTDENGVFKQAIDFDLLKQELSSSIVEGARERYHLDWVGKREALLTANAPVAKTLRPAREESVDFETTKNLYIEGDNLDALKLLQETYLGKVKMIYIDPPYNTGNDFIYEDDFAESAEVYFERSMQKDEQGNRLVANAESNGRFHSDWLNMLYPRLKLARNLLSDNGLVFISIDDIEVMNLRSICNEVFGAENYFSEIVWKNKTGGGAKTKGWIGLHEYILCYAKNINSILDISIPYSDKTASMYNKRDDQFEIRGPYATWPLDTTSMGDRPNLRFPISHNGLEIWPEKQWLWSKERVVEAQKNNMLEFNKQPDGSFKIRFKGYLKDENGVMRRGKPLTILDGPYTQEGSKDFQTLFPKSIFPFPKPVRLLKELLLISTEDGKDQGGIVLDFFSGSATTAHAVMQLNAEDGGNRQFIMIQLPETTDEKSEAFKAGFRTIADIGRERIRRAGKKIKEELERKNAENKQPLLDKESEIRNPKSEIRLDTGFRVLKVDTSNMKDVYYAPDKIEQGSLLDAVGNVKEDRTDEDLLFQVLLDWGVDLSVSMARETIAGKSVFWVDETAVAACFETGITDNFVKELAKREPLRAVFKNSAFENDSVKINVEQIFKLMSPGTEVKTI